MLNELLADPSTRRPLREMILASLQRDPLDALADAEALTDLLRKRFEEVCPDASTKGRAQAMRGLQQHPSRTIVSRYPGAPT